jgi:hypothetical protein
VFDVRSKKLTRQISRRFLPMFCLKNLVEPDVIAHTCNPLLGRWKLGGSQFKASLGKKVQENPISTSNSCAWWHMPAIPMSKASIGG